VDPDIHCSNRSTWGAGGLQLSSNQPGFPADRALEAIRQFIADHGRQPTAESWQAAQMSPCEKTIRRRFGSFRQAIERAGRGEAPE
jgi:hypothetical protein